MREKQNHLYLDSHEKSLLLHSLVELKNQLIQQGRSTDCIDIKKDDVRADIIAGLHVGKHSGVCYARTLR